MNWIMSRNVKSSFSLITFIYLFLFSIGILATLITRIFTYTFEKWIYRIKYNWKRNLSSTYSFKSSDRGLMNEVEQFWMPKDYRYSKVKTENSTRSMRLYNSIVIRPVCVWARVKFITHEMLTLTYASFF